MDPNKSNYDLWWKIGWGDPAAWGNVRTPIEPLPTTHTGGRDEMRVHGGSAPGSIGFIDLTSSIDEFHEWINKLTGPAPSTVDYPGYKGRGAGGLFYLFSAPTGNIGLLRTGELTSPGKRYHFQC